MVLSGEIIRFAALVSGGLIDFPEDPSVTNQLNINGSGLGTSIFQCLQIILNFTSPSFIFVENFGDTIAPNSSVFPFHEIAANATKTNISSTENHDIYANSYIFKTDQIDIAFGFFYFLPTRSTKATALMPISDEKFSVYFLQPQFTQFDNPFNRQFSSGLFFAHLLIMIIASFLLLWSIGLETTNCINFCELIYGIVLWAVGTWCQQGSSLNTFRKWQPKLIMSIVSFLSFLLYSMYCAVIIATLTRNVAPIRKMEHLFHYQYTFFAPGVAKDTLLKGIERKWNPPAPSSSLEAEEMEAYEKSASILRLIEPHQRHAHIATYDLFYPDLDIVFSSYFDGATTLESRKICERLSEFPMMGGGLYSGFYVKKGFRFQNEFNYAITKSRETGVFSRAMETYEAIRFENVECWDSIKRSTYNDDLGLTYLGVMFTGLAAAGFVALLILLTEILQASVDTSSHLQEQQMSIYLD